MSYSEEIWKAWKGFPEWFARYRSADWKDASKISNPDWTNGVINPFIVTSVAPRLDCKVRITHQLRDAELLRDNSLFAHIELENELEKVSTETKKLRDSEALVKCIVSYGKSEQVEEQATAELEPMIANTMRKGSTREWLLIYGVYTAHTREKGDYMGMPTDWVVYGIRPVQQQPLLIRLEW